MDSILVVVIISNSEPLVIAWIVVKVSQSVVIVVVGAFIAQLMSDCN